MLGNDSDLEESPLTAVLVSGPAHGAVKLGPDGSFSYRPQLGFSGTDQFEYRASDGTAEGTPKVVTLAIGSPPASTPGVRLQGAGLVGAGRGRALLMVSAATKSDGSVTGSLGYQEMGRGLTFRSTRLTSLVVDATRTRLHSTGVSSSGGTLPFVLELEIARAPRKTSVRLELGDGRVIGPATVSGAFRLSRSSG